MMPKLQILCGRALLFCQFHLLPIPRRKAALSVARCYAKHNQKAEAAQIIQTARLEWDDFTLNQFGIPESFSDSPRAGWEGGQFGEYGDQLDAAPARD
jgi:hypothetical protein